MSQNGKLMPNLDEKSTKLLNMTVLQRIDPFVEEILFTAAHVTFYEFNIETSQWSRKDVEGSFFVVKRNTQPRFQFIVMNRRSTDNLVENLLEDFEFEVQVPYLLYRNASQEVNGIWFYNAHECEEVANLFTRILNAYAKVPGKTKISPSRSEFEELEAVPTMEVIDGPLEPSSTSSNGPSDTPDDRKFVNFFSSAVNVGNPPTAISGHAYQSPGSALPEKSPATIGSAPNVAMPYPSPQTNVPTDQPGGSLPVLPLPHVPSKLPPPNPLLSILDNSESGGSIKHAADLVKPSSFFASPPSTSPFMMPPITSSVPTAPPLSYSVSGQRPYGTPLLQPFPPPTPPPALTPAPASNYGPVMNREKIRDALQMLVQDNQFIDMVYQAVLKAHHS